MAIFQKMLYFIKNIAIINLRTNFDNCTQKVGEPLSKEKIAKKDLEETLIDDYYVLDSIAEDAKAGYILEAEATLKQDGEKDTQDITLVVVKVDGKWVIVSGL